MNYLEYGVEEFVLDEYFQKWILDNDPMVASFWERWLEENPHKRQDIEGASRIVRAIQFKEDSHTEDEFNQVWNNIILKRNGKSQEKGSVPLWARRKTWMAIIKVAAVVLVAAFVSLALGDQFVSPSQPVEVASLKTITKRTGTGEKLTFQLADGSIVKLNSNSQLTFPELFDSTTRTVELTGEAFFDIAYKCKHPFRVITGNVGTQVLGTSFNIKAYSGEKSSIDVALVTGKVVVGQYNQNEIIEKLRLEPGQMASYDQSKNTFQKSIFEYDEIVGWKDGILIFKDQDITSIIRKIEDWYNVKVVVEKDDLDMDRDFSGKYKNKTLDVVLKGLGYAYHFKYKIDNHIVVIK